MRLPYAKYTNSPAQIRTIDFKGYCVRPIIEDGQMRDMKNLSSDGYPNMTQRKMRRVVADNYTNPSSIASRKEKLVVVDGTNLYYDGVVVGTLTAGEKQIASINSKICIFPDKKYYDTVEKEFGFLDASCSIETSDTVYIKVSNNSLLLTGATFKDFKAGDAVKIDGFTKKVSNNLSAILVNATETMLEFAPDTFTVLEGDSTYNKTDKTYKEDGEISITRSAPELDFVMEYNNRLWGCAGSTIYASKLGDPTNWNYFNGLSMDSYAVDVGSDGDFTGCAATPSHLVFFKDNVLHKLYGSKPSNFQTMDVKADGVQKGCENSLCLINGILYYKSRNGVMAYDSGVPECISRDLGDDVFREAAAGTDGVKYYISMQRQKDEGAAVLVEDGHLLGRDGIDVDQQVVEGEHNALGETCGTRGVENYAHVAILETDALFLGHLVRAKPRKVVHAKNHGVHASLLYGFQCYGLCLLCNPNGIGLGIVHYICHVVCRTAGIHGNGYATVLPDGEETVYPFHTVFCEDNCLCSLFHRHVLCILAYVGKHLGIGNFTIRSDYCRAVYNLDFVFVKHCCL